MKKCERFKKNLEKKNLNIKNNKNSLKNLLMMQKGRQNKLVNRFNEIYKKMILEML
jgi:CRISPR/Cas system CSM-associated protein Csm2 small subunit